ncbi:MAG: DUF883 domain-containing protein [wastewater metagenome]|nr:DUF883 domain-containing protein [Candidatus Loosdrechtia aerotolerans]
MVNQAQEGRKTEAGVKEEKAISANEKINRALQLLDEAAREKKEELNHLISEKYSNVREFMNQTAETYKGVIDKTKHSIDEAMISGEERIKEMKAGLDQKFHENPWPFLIITSIICLASGFIIGGTKRPTR